MIGQTSDTERLLDGRRQWGQDRYPNPQIVSQVSLELPCDDTNITFVAARREAIRWIRNRTGGSLPRNAWEGHSFSKEVGTQRAEAIRLSDTFWAATHTDADKNVAQRSWITEFDIRLAPKQENVVLFGCRLTCTTLGENPAYTRSVPGIVRQIIDNTGGVVDGRAASTSAWYVRNECEVDELVAFLTKPDRQRAVIIVSSDSDGKTLVPADDLAKSLIGMSHVVDISSEASYILTDQVGREFSVFGGAIRTYRTGFSPDADEPFTHPLATPGRIVSWVDETQTFSEFLIDRTVKEFLSSRHIRKEVRSFASVRAEFNKQERDRLLEEGASDSELLKVAEDEVSDLRGNVTELEQLLEEAEKERDRAIEERNEARADRYHLQEQIGNLREQQKNGGVEDPELPDSLSELEDWANKNLSGSVKILNRAYRAAKKSVFEDTRLVYQALLLLRDYYVPMRQGLKTQDEYYNACGEIGVEETQTIGASVGEFGQTYYVDHNSRKRFLAKHLKKGNARDPRHCFRLYFFWDDEDQQVVVGSLPEHLDSRTT